MVDVIELLAVVSSAMYGVLLARRHQMDFVGVFCLAFIVAFGGGTIRDVFLDRQPLFWIRKSHYPVIVFVISLVTSLLPAMPGRTERILSVPDALGLGLFSIAGANAATDAGLSLFNASLMGVVTGTFGGVMGDIICNRVPSLFRPAPLFATCSFAGCWVYFLLGASPVSEPWAATVAIGFIVVFRLAAIRYDLYLPHLGSESETRLPDSTDRSGDP